MKVDSSMVTHSIMEPPVRTGGIASRSERRPHRAPAPVGPSILWEENTAKSTSRVDRSRGM